MQICFLQSSYYASDLALSLFITYREYAPPELAARFIEQLVNGYGNDADITNLLQTTEIHWIPCKFLLFYSTMIYLQMSGMLNIKSHSLLLLSCKYQM